MRCPMPRLAARFILLLFVVAACPAAASAQITRVQPPARKASSPDRVAKVKKARAQGIEPRKMAGIARSLDRRTKSLGDQHLDSRRYRQELSTAPLPARLEVYIKAAARRGVTVQTFQRRLRGMSLVRGKTKVVTPKKTFFEVTPETFDLFHRIMGENVIWFAAAPNPGHLHTLIADQNGGKNFTHNTYGQGPLDAASIGSEQYVAPAFLTGPEMDRFVRWLNSSVKNGKKPVYGFKRSNGEYVCDTNCTNWATIAPVGDLERWVRTVDRRVAKAASEGRLPAKYRGGLHSLLAATPTREARVALVAELVAAEGLTPHTRASAKRLGKEFEIVAEKWPSRPLDLVGRQSLGEVMGVARSKDPAKWMYDLFMSKRVPVIAVVHKTAKADFADTLFDLEEMGNIDQNGDVVPGENNRGVVPPERRPGYVRPPPAAETTTPAAETPAAETPATEPAAAPTEP